MSNILTNTARYLLVLSMILALASCRADPPPRNMLEEDILVPILVDFHLAYSVQSTQEFRNLTRKADSVDTFSSIFIKHEVDKADFDSTIAWLSRNPEPFTDIYDQVVMQLNQLADTIRAIYGNPQGE